MLTAPHPTPDPVPARKRGRPRVLRVALPKPTLTGDQFRRIRTTKLKLTQVDMAALLGIKREHYAMVELDRANPSPTLCILARLLGKLGRAGLAQLDI